MNKMNLIAKVIFIFATFLLLNTSCNGNKSSKNINYKEYIDIFDIEYPRYGTTSDIYRKLGITGKIKNKSDKIINVILHYKFLEPLDNTVERKSIAVLELHPNDIQRFSVISKQSIKDINDEELFSQKASQRVVLENVELYNAK